MSKKVMVVDDSRFVFEEMKFVLKDSDYEVVYYCKNGEEAVDAYEKNQPDIVTMDIILPGIDGLEAGEAILSKWPDACVIMVSSLAYEDTIEQAHKLGARGFVFKPFERDQIISSFNEALKQK